MDADRLKQLGQNTRLLAAVTKDERNVLISSAQHCLCIVGFKYPHELLTVKMSLLKVGKFFCTFFC
jgi:hypothetical protein